MTPLLPTRELDDLENRLRATFHAVDVASPEPSTRPALTAGDAPPALPRRHTTRRVLITGFAVAAAGTAVAAVVGTKAGTSPAEAAGAAALRRAASRASRAAFVAPGADQYLYVRIVAKWSTSAGLADGGSLMFLLPQIVERWQPVDPARAGLQRSTPGEPIFLRPGDEEKARAAGLLDNIGKVGEDDLPPNDFGDDFTAPSWPFLASLPTDPDTLYDKVEAYSRGHGPSLHEEMLVTISDALKYAIAPPAVVAACYEVAARVPGIELVPGAVDLSGRHGVAVALAGAATRQELIFDDTTGVFLGTRELLTAPSMGYPAGTLFGSQASRVTFVDAIGDH